MSCHPTSEEPTGVRGALLVRAREALRELEDAGRLDRDVLLARLLPEDLPYLYGDLASDRWYPIETCDRMSRVACAAAGLAPSEFLVSRGRGLAEALLERPIVRALESGPPLAGPWWGPAGHLLVTLPSSLFTHSTWILLPDDDPGRFTIEVSDAGCLPETARFGVQGALEVLAERLSGRPVRVSGERPEADRIVFLGRPPRDA